MVSLAYADARSQFPAPGLPGTVHAAQTGPGLVTAQAGASRTDVPGPVIILAAGRPR